MSSRAFYRDRYSEAEQGGRGPEDEATFHLRVGAALRVIGSEPKRILDFGCGTGASTRILAEAGHDVLGVEASESGLRVAAAHPTTARFQLIDSEASLPFEAGAFDVCFCTEVIEHLLDVAGFVREVYRVLAKDGLFVITTPYHGWIKNLLVISMNFDVHFDPVGEHIRFFSRRSLEQCLTNAGFEIMQFEGIGRFWPVWKSMFVVARRA
jgi:2-polyprenyl-3-methyl-5-hydroxy-6-metoxy-1,4-benzoquinol methylase